MSEQPEKIIPAAQKIRHDWFDVGNTVEVSVYIKKINADSVNLDLQPKAVSITFKDSNEHIYELKFDQLFDEIDVEKLSFKVYGTKLTLLLIKKNAIVWRSLEFDGTNVVASNTYKVEDDSPNTGKDSWSKYKEFKDIDDDENEEDSDNPQSFFQKLFKDATPDVQRAMMKSFTESNGTNLSTDWADVGGRTVEPET